jgi:hypothetical protein
VAGVYLIYRNRLFRDTVAAILTTQPEIRLLGAADQPDKAASEITARAPSVILLEEVEDGPSLRDVQYILTSPIPYRLITLRLDQDGMHVWSQTWRQTVSPQDLVEAIITAKEDKTRRYFTVRSGQSSLQRTSEPPTTKQQSARSPAVLLPRGYLT